MNTKLFVCVSLTFASFVNSFIVQGPFQWEKLRYNMAASSDSSSSMDLGYTLKERNPYDVHVYYSTPEEEKKAFILREKMQEKFSSWMRFYPPKGRPIGPHPVPMWEVDFGAYENRSRLQEICDFLEQEKGNLSILVHPHSTDTDYADHTKHAIWFGKRMELRFEGWPR